MKMLAVAVGLVVLGVGCGKSGGDGAGSSAPKEGSSSSASAKAPPTFTPGNEPAANKFCKGADGTYQDCAIACDTTHAVDVCKLADEKAGGVCKRIGKSDCEASCKKGDQHLCKALESWTPATCASAGTNYGKLFGEGFNQKAHVADDKKAAVVSGAQAATTDSCTKNAWPSETIECVAAAEVAADADSCLFKLEASLHSPLGKGPSHDLTKALTDAVKKIADGAAK